MTKIDIFSGFLGAGKTTLIKKLIKEGYKGEKLVLIENEFGEIGIDGGFLKEAGVQINEMNSGCICCSLVGDFSKALEQVITEYNPDRILIEPSGVGKLSDVIKAVENANTHGAVLGSFTTVADAGKVKLYMKNFGEFYNDQIENACTIFLSRTQETSEDKVEKAVEMLREHNKDAVIITTDWDKLTGEQMIAAMESRKTVAHDLEELEKEAHEHHHEHHHHDHEHHHDHDEECSCGCHHHDHEHHHEHHHEHGEECGCGCHHHGHDHHHHHADEVFTSWGIETTRKYTVEKLAHILHELEHEEEYGFILRAKGIVEGEDGNWIHFDYVPSCPDIRSGAADVIGKLCVIGSKMDEAKIKELFK